jgi:hypothetical protein
VFGAAEADGDVFEPDAPQIRASRSNFDHAALQHIDNAWHLMVR